MFNVRAGQSGRGGFRAVLLALRAVENYSRERTGQVLVRRSSVNSRDSERARYSSWSNFSEDADQAGISRRYGGIHFELGDLAGRATGGAVAKQAWKKSLRYFRGDSDDEAGHERDEHRSDFQNSQF